MDDFFPPFDRGCENALVLEVFWINFETVLFLVGATKQTNYLTFGKTSNRFVFGGYNKTNQIFRDLGGWVEFLNSLSLLVVLVVLEVRLLSDSRTSSYLRTTASAVASLSTAAKSNLTHINGQILPIR